MRRLILFRHAKAEARAASGGDFERRLTGRGRHDAALMGSVIAARRFEPDLALVSAAARARETWEEAAPALSGGRCELRRELYNASAEDLERDIVAAAPTVSTLMVLGHNPGLQELAVGLLTAGGAPDRDIDAVSSHFATATVAVLDIRDDGGARLGALLHARDHGGEGE